jgi:protein-tyrosine phosphatase
MKSKIRNQLKKWIKGDLRNLYWRIYGNTIRNPRLPSLPESFLFICKGNICRSPFAEHLAVKLAGDGPTHHKTFFSAGLHVSRPLPPPREGVLAAQGFGVQLDGHRSKRIDEEMADRFDMIIAMETWQFHALRKAFPVCRHKAFLLPLFDSKEKAECSGFARYNIQDPYGRSVSEFRVCFERIERCLRRMFAETLKARQSRERTT